MAPDRYALAKARQHAHARLDADDFSGFTRDDVVDCLTAAIAAVTDPRYAEADGTTLVERATHWARKRAYEIMVDREYARLVEELTA